jgi:hypothetical protein
MADIKRPNYFTSQFLVERDFNDEQAYHLGARRRHNRVQHTSGVVEGLDVKHVSATQVQILPGVAVDRDGREIVVTDPVTYTLTTAGNDLDVFLTVAYQETFDPADHYTQAGLDKFTRTTEHPRFQDGTAAPPADGSAIALAKIRLNATGAIESNASIDGGVRVLGGPRIPPKAVTTAQLADGAVTLEKLAADAQPTAAQVDNRGGVNQLVAQINAGTGVITRTHLEPTVVSGVVTFQNVAINAELFSNEIDPGLGSGALSLQLALDDFTAANLTSGGDTSYGRPILLRSEVNRATGRFRIFVTRTPASGSVAAMNLTVRWYAIRAVVGPDATTSVGVAVNPPSAKIVNNTPQQFTAVVSNATNTGVVWTAPQGGTLSGTTPTATTFNPPGISGPYSVVATSLADPNAKIVVPIDVNADVTVSVTPHNPTVFRGESKVLTATVVNTQTTDVTWSIPPGSAGSLSSATPNAVTYTAPTAPGNYTVVATSVADGRRSDTVTIAVPEVTFSIRPDDFTVTAGHTTVVRATVGGSSNANASWFSISSVASVSPAFGPTTTFQAPGVGGSFDVKGVSAADPNKFMTVTIDVPNIKTGTEGGGGKFAPAREVLPFSMQTSGPSAADTLDTSDESASADVVEGGAPEAKARAFITPKKRGSPKLPPKPDK